MKEVGVLDGKPGNVGQDRVQKDLHALITEAVHLCPSLFAVLRILFVVCQQEIADEVIRKGIENILVD